MNPVLVPAGMAAVRKVWPLVAAAVAVLALIAAGMVVVILGVSGAQQNATLEALNKYCDIAAQQQAAQATSRHPRNAASGGVTAPVRGQIGVAQANIPGRSGLSGMRSSLPRALAGRPDFVSLNEQESHTLGQVEAATPGYSTFTVGRSARPRAKRQVMNNAIFYRDAKWRLVDSGQDMVVEDDRVFYPRGSRIVHLWDSFATWALFKRKSDGALVGFVSTHMPNNPAKDRPNPKKRKRVYSAGMDALLSRVSDLAQHGPVLVAGDMNTHMGQSGTWTAAAKMKSAGYRGVAHSVDHIYYPTGVTLADSGSGPMASDHNWVGATFNMNGVGAKEKSSGTASASAVPAVARTGPDEVDAVGCCLPDGAAPPASGDPAATTVSTAPNAQTLSADQAKNARHIVAEAMQRGGSAAAVVAITTALTESGLRTDPGSLGGAYGVFQQTPSQGWGSIRQVMDVDYATDAFLDRLMLIPMWQQMEPWRAAQAVQRSGAGAATSGRANYGPEVPQAREIVAALGGDVEAAAGDGVTSATDICPAGGGATAQGVSQFAAGGNFASTSASYVGPYDRAELLNRMNTFVEANGTNNLDPFFHSVSSWYRMCQHAVANLSGRSHSGYTAASSAWSSLIAQGVAHPASSPDGMSPPVGAWLYYESGWAGHVAVYMGNNQVASTDTWGSGTFKYGPASDLTNGEWNLQYLGWAAPWGEEHENG